MRDGSDDGVHSVAEAEIGEAVVIVQSLPVQTVQSLELGVQLLVLVVRSCE